MATRPALAFVLLVTFLGPGVWAAESPAQLDARKDAALELTVNIMVAEGDAERIDILRKLAAYRYPDVAQALVQLAEEDLLSSTVMRELEWVLVAMGDLALKPLADSLAARQVPADFVTIVWKRIARQSPDLLVPFLESNAPQVAHSAALAVATCQHPGSIAAIEGHFGQAPATAQAVLLEAGCLTNPGRCVGLLNLGRESDHVNVRAKALAVAAGNGEWLTNDALATALHDPDVNLVRAALSVLEGRSSKGLERDLAILLKSAQPDIQERALRAVARAGTRDASSILQEVVLNHAPASLLGRVGRELVRQGTGETVIVGDALDAVPIDATLATLADGRLALRLYNDDGFRVVVRGAIYVKCKGMPQSRTNVQVADFSADGTLALRVQCQSGGPPEVRWKRRDGHLVRARIQDL